MHREAKEVDPSRVKFTAQSGGRYIGAVRWWERRARSPQRQRLSGPPTSPNGASSFHLWWAPDHPGPYREASVILQVERPPTVPRLYFWALQVSFLDRGRLVGGAHTGLQWHPYAPAGAVNWGGYAEGGGGPGELDGLTSALVPVDGPNTFHFPWRPSAPYRFRVWSPGAGAWRAEVTDLEQAQTTVIRDLMVPADELGGPVVWSEVFARCDDPATEVRWSHLEIVLPGGDAVPVCSVRPTYQSYAEGGCANTESRAEGDHFVQTTGLPSARRPQPGLLTVNP